MSHTPSLTAPDMAGTDRDFHTGQKSEPMPEDTVLNIADIGTCTYKLPEHSQEFLNRSYTPKKRPSMAHIPSLLTPDIADTCTYTAKPTSTLTGIFEQAIHTQKATKHGPHTLPTHSRHSWHLQQHPPSSRTLTGIFEQVIHTQKATKHNTCVLYTHPRHSLQPIHTLTSLPEHSQEFLNSSYTSKKRPSMVHIPSLLTLDTAGICNNIHQVAEHSQEFLNRSYTPKKRPSMTHMSSILTPDIAYNLYIH